MHQPEAQPRASLYFDYRVHPAWLPSAHEVEEEVQVAIVGGGPIGLGLFSRESLLMSAILLPLVPIGVRLGMALLARIPERPFYLFATAMLGLSGLKLLWDALVG